MTEPLRLLLRLPLLRRLWLGALISALGDSLTWMALLWYVTERTGSGAAVGIVLLCFGLPAAFSAGPLGRLLDRVQPRTVMLVDNLARAFLIALMPALAALGTLSMPVLYVLAALAGLLAPATQVGVRLLIPRLVSDEELEGGNAAHALTEQIATVGGPALAGFLIYATGALGALWIDAGSFLFMAWAVWAMPDLPRTRTPGQAPPERESPRTVLRRYPAVAVVTIISAVFFFAYGPTEAALPLFIRVWLHGDARALGWIWSILGIGAGLGGLATSWLARRVPTGVALSSISLLWGVAGIAFATARSVPMAALAYFVGGVVWGPYMALKTTLIQRSVPAERLGAVLGLHAAVLTPILPLGTALGGVLLRTFDAPTVIALASVACVIAGIGALLIPAMRRA
jgi:predicted MFS family arabinose efflux permease